MNMGIYLSTSQNKKASPIACFSKTSMTPMII
jgi:hypothetical protein